MKHRAPAALLVGAAAASAVFLALQRPDRAPSAESAAAPAVVAQPAPAAPSSDPELRRLRRELAALRGEVSDLRRSREPGAAAEPAPDPRSPAALQAAHAAREERIRAAEQDFDAQSATRESVGLESDLKDRLAADAALRDAVRGVSCRAETCRVELDGRGAAVQRGLPSFLLHMVPVLPRAVVKSVALADGGQQLVLFMSRAADGPALPRKP